MIKIRRSTYDLLTGRKKKHKGRTVNPSQFMEVDTNALWIIIRAVFPKNADKL